MPPNCPFTITSLTSAPEPEPLQQLLTEYWQVIIPKLRALGGPDLSPAALAQDNLADLTPYLPPNGRIFLAHSPDGTLLGSGFLHRITPNAGEMKRLFVRPAAQGTGLGRALVEARITAAREMGLQWLYADTLKGNTPMLRLYERLGFQQVSRYPGHENYPEVMDHITFRGLRL